MRSLFSGPFSRLTLGMGGAVVCLVLLGARGGRPLLGQLTGGNPPAATEGGLPPVCFEIVPCQMPFPVGNTLGFIQCIGPQKNGCILGAKQQVAYLAFSCGFVWEMPPVGQPVMVYCPEAAVLGPCGELIGAGKDRPKQGSSTVAARPSRREKNALSGVGEL